VTPQELILSYKRISKDLKEGGKIFGIDIIQELKLNEW